MYNILCFGDSNTYGMIPSSEEKRYPPEERWPGILQSLLPEDFRVIEEGLSGRTIGCRDFLDPWHCGADYLFPCLKSHLPLDLMLIMLGTNDCKSRFSLCAEEIAMSMNRLLKQVLHSPFLQYPSPKILLISPVPIGAQQAEEEFDSASVEKSVRLAPLYQKLAAGLGLDFLSGAAMDISLGSDCLHFTPAGHRKFAGAVYDYLCKRGIL